MRLNLGCGYRHQDGYINVDLDPVCAPQVQADLEHARWPWDDASVDEVRMCHSLEHMGETVATRKFVMQEMYRVLKPGGLVNIAIPWHKHAFFWNDPTHVWPITVEQLMLFDRALNQWNREHFSAHTPLAEYWGIDLRIVPNSVEYHLDQNGEVGKQLSAGQISQAEVHRRAESDWGVVMEVSLQMRKYPLEAPE